MIEPGRKNQKSDVEPDEREAATEAESGHEIEAVPEPELPADEPEDTMLVGEEALHQQIAELKDQLLRALAETENLRKRARREVEDANKYAVANFARDMVGVADNLNSALEFLTDEMRETSEAVKNLGEGVEMTRRALETALARHGIARIDPVGEPFDHNFHQAMFEIEDSGQAPGTVVQVVQVGYRIHDRLLRPAMVGVAKKPARDAKVDTEA